METSHLSPEGISLPPSPVDSFESADSTASHNAATKRPEESENVMITLSLTPEPQRTSSPARLPFTRSHFRSRSLAEVSGLPPMIRAHSSPGLDSRGRYIFINGRGGPANSVESPARRYLPLQVTPEEHLESRMLPLNISETISEHAELDTSMSAASQDHLPASPVLSHTFPRVSRRRPSSPLHFNSMNPMGTAASSPSPSSAQSSPVVLGSRFNEAYPSNSASSTSSMPSTPTSIRSRSPSISSLETIPDIPDAEAAAIEDDQIAALKAAADRADEEADGNGSRRRGASDASGPSNSFMNIRGGSGGYGIRADKRKRWSVCGAERRQDLDLETIWED